jgi:hypothetical protein
METLDRIDAARSRSRIMRRTVATYLLQITLGGYLARARDAQCVRVLRPSGRTLRGRDRLRLAFPFTFKTQRLAQTTSMIDIRDFPSQEACRDASSLPCGSQPSLMKPTATIICGFG